MTKTPTPETDAAEMTAAIIAVNLPPSSARFVHADFARKLERERDAERALADRLAETLGNIKHVNCGLFINDTHRDALTAWKEDRK